MARWLRVNGLTARQAQQIQDTPGVRADPQRGGWLVPVSQRHALSALIAGRPLPPPIPAVWSTATPPWAHQSRALVDIFQRHACLLDGDPGTGKSKIALDLIVNRGHRTILIVCPKPVIPVWEQQIERHMEACGAVRTVALDVGSAAKSAACLRDAIKYRRDGLRVMVLVNYELVWRHPLGAAVLATPWDAIICDEGHRLVSAGSRQSRFLARVAHEHPGAQRLALSGTPLPTSILDAYGIYRFLDSSVFGTRYHDFKQRYAIFSPYNQYVITGWQNQGEFQQKYGSLRHHIPASVLDLPPVHHIDVPTVLPDAARRVYRDLYRDFTVRVKDGSITASNALTHVLRLQQLTSGFARLDDDDAICPRPQPQPLHSAKLDTLTQMLQDAPPTPVVVFCRFLYDLEQTHKAARAANRPYSELSSARKDLPTWLMDPTGVLGVQIQTGAEGLNDLVHAHHAVFFSPPISLAKFDQAVARLHRPGQQYPVIIWHLICPQTIDTTTYSALESRRDVMQTIIDGASAVAGG